MLKEWQSATSAFARAALISWFSFLFSCLNACVVQSVKMTSNFFYRVTPLKIFNENRGQGYVLPRKICQEFKCFIWDANGFHFTYHMLLDRQDASDILINNTLEHDTIHLRIRSRIMNGRSVFEDQKGLRDLSLQGC
jgi:hypothetical protein